MASQQMPSAGTVEERLAQRAIWALGDYHRVAEVLAGFGPNLVSACSISAGAAGARRGHGGSAM